MPDNYELLPTERPTPEQGFISLDLCQWLQIEPSADFIESVRTLGVIQPIAVVKAGRRFNVAAGRRRCTAAQRVGITSIPALIFPAGTPMHVAAAIALAENNQRRPNPITDLRAIEALAREGVPVDAIARDLRLPMGTVRARMRLAALLPELREAVESGRLSPTLAEQAARMDTTRQGELLALLRGRIEEAESEEQAARARLTAHDVRDRLEVVRAANFEAFPAATLNPEPVSPPRRAPQPVATDPTTVQAEAIVGGADARGDWRRLYLFLEAATRVLPTAADDEAEQVYQLVTDALVLVRARGEREGWVNA
jgi:ParB/RepB/Spo0J family partition protein